MFIIAILRGWRCISRLPDSLDELDFGIMLPDSLDEPGLWSISGFLGRTWTSECYRTPWTNLDFGMFPDSLDEPGLWSVSGLLGRTWTLEYYKTQR
ncbi:unnamed protein product [Rhizophagus irregularis]|nr:unnamed protein product [Rhizophagus irregularis]